MTRTPDEMQVFFERRQAELDKTQNCPPRPPVQPDNGLLFPDSGPMIPSEPMFGGTTYEPARDSQRLRGQLRAVYELMRDERWRTLAEIKAAVGRGSEAGLSARLRDLRKPKFLGCTVRSRPRIGCAGTWEYRLEA